MFKNGVNTLREFSCKPGDVLLYGRHPTLLNDLVDVGERMEDGAQKYEFYHVAIALSSYDKIETSGSEVDIVTIDYANCRVFRPPYDAARLPSALAWSRRQRGKLYGWIGVIDQGLRDVSAGRLHLPIGLVRWANKHWPYCSILTSGVMLRAGFNDLMRRLGKPVLRLYPPPSPEDIYLAVKDWEVVT